VIDVRLLGPLQVHVGERVLGPRQFDGVKTKQLFEILVLARGRTVSREQLAELLWEDNAPRNIAGTLGTYVSILRRRLGLDALIETSANGYRYVPGSADLDVDRFDRLTASAASAGPGQARRDLEAAIRLVRGDLLEDEPYAAWVDPHRAAYRTRFGQTLVLAAGSALACRDHDAAVCHAERAVELEPLSESATRALMLGRYALGQQDRAIAAFQRVREGLTAELGVRPMEETWKLLRDIAAQEPVADLLPAPAWDEPPATIDLRATHGPLLGRAAESRVLHAAVAAAEAGRTALVLVEGEAGMGKSRLMADVTEGLQGMPVGRARCSRLERELLFVPLMRAIRSALPPVAGTILRDRYAALGEAGTTQTVEGVADLIDAHGPMVLVLDDAQWADPATVTTLAYLSSGDHPLAVLAGSRPSLVTPADPLYWLEPQQKVTLGPLTPDDLATVGVPDLHRRTGGHPFLVAEWLRARAEHALDELPLRLGPWIREQAGGDLAHQLLVTAALIGSPFEVDEVTPVLGPLTPELVDAADRLVRRGLLEVAPEGLRFRQPLLQEALGVSVSPWRRRVLGAMLSRRAPVAAAG
jgi:DNA-binding SARP family transcriptional activator